MEMPTTFTGGGQNHEKIFFTYLPLVYGIDAKIAILFVNTKRFRKKKTL